jgi:hypothetical protein
MNEFLSLFQHVAAWIKKVLKSHKTLNAHSSRCAIYYYFDLCCVAKQPLHFYDRLGLTFKTESEKFMAHVFVRWGFLKTERNKTFVRVVALFS